MEANRTRCRNRTPLCTYISAPGPGRGAVIGHGAVFRIEPEYPRDHDDTPAYVFSADEIRPRADEEQLLFGDWLVRRGLISRFSLYAALAEATAADCRVGDALVTLRMLRRRQVEEEARAFNVFLSFRGGQPLQAPR